jgi:hypothetical protein
MHLIKQEMQIIKVFWTTFPESDMIALHTSLTVVASLKKMKKMKDSVRHITLGVQFVLN